MRYVPSLLTKCDSRLGDLRVVRVNSIYNLNHFVGHNRTREECYGC